MRSSKREECIVSERISDQENIPAVSSAPGPGGHVRDFIGRVITAEDLPKSHAIKWDTYKKMAVVASVDNGLILLEETTARYWLNPFELPTWKTLL